MSAARPDPVEGIPPWPVNGGKRWPKGDLREGSNLIRVLIVDDQGPTRSLLATLLSADPQVHLVGDCSDGLDALRVAADQRPDVVLMDLDMPGMDGVTTTARLRPVLPDTHVIIYTSTLSALAHVAALRAGACQVLTKDASPVQILSAVHACGTSAHPAGRGTQPTRLASDPG